MGYHSKSHRWPWQRRAARKDSEDAGNPFPWEGHSCVSNLLPELDKLVSGPDPDGEWIGAEDYLLRASEDESVGYSHKGDSPSAASLRYAPDPTELMFFVAFPEYLPWLRKERDLLHQRRQEKLEENLPYTDLHEVKLRKFVKDPKVRRYIERTLVGMAHAWGREGKFRRWDQGVGQWWHWTAKRIKRRTFRKLSKKFGEGWYKTMEETLRSNVSSEPACSGHQ